MSFMKNNIFENLIINLYSIYIVHKINKIVPKKLPFVIPYKFHKFTFTIQLAENFPILSRTFDKIKKN